MTSSRASGLQRGAPRSRRKSEARGQGRWALLFIAPIGIGLAIFYIWPIVTTIYLSLGKTGVFGGWEWIGFANYSKVFTDEEFARALGNTLVYTGLVLFSIPIALVIAVLLQTKGLRFVGTLRVAYFLPIVTLPAAVGWIWSLIYNGDFGALNAALGAIGIEGTSWLTNPATALGAIGVVGIWISLGYPVMLFIAALQNVPSEISEAAEIDGAGPARRFFSVTIPLITPTIFFVVVLTIIGALQVFDLIFVMIGQTSPVLPETETVIYLFYRTAFLEHNQGLASAIVTVLLLLIMLLTAAQFRLQRRWVHYD